MSLSAVVLTKNSSSILEKCLRSLSWCDEIIVVDDGSIDNTKSIAKKFGAEVFEHDLDNDFSKQRNFGLKKASGDWILFVDSDEIVAPLLQKEIIEYTNNLSSEYKGCYLKRIDTMWEKKLTHGETGNIWFLRLAKKNSGRWSGKVHEVWEVEGKIGKLKNELFHFPHPSIKEFLSKINFYSTLRAKELYEKKTRVSGFDIILYPKAKFYLNYFFNLGFLDGVPGFLVAVLMSFHSFLVRGKLWQLQDGHQ